MVPHSRMSPLSIIGNLQHEATQDDRAADRPGVRATADANKGLCSDVYLRRWAWRRLCRAFALTGEGQGACEKGETHHAHRSLSDRGADGGYRGRCDRPGGDAERLSDLGGRDVPLDGRRALPCGRRRRLSQRLRTRVVAGFRSVRMGLSGAGVLVHVRTAHDGPARCDRGASRRAAPIPRRNGRWYGGRGGGFRRVSRPRASTDRPLSLGVAGRDSWGHPRRGPVRRSKETP